MGVKFLTGEPLEVGPMKGSVESVIGYVRQRPGSGVTRERTAHGPTVTEE